MITFHSVKSQCHISRHIKFISKEKPAENILAVTVDNPPLLHLVTANPEQFAVWYVQVSKVK